MAHEYKPRAGWPLDYARCRAEVWFSCGRESQRKQCSRKAVVDGKWCKQHSPEGEVAREEQVKHNRAEHYARTPLGRAKTKIEKLEAKIKELGAEIERLIAANADPYVKRG